MKTKSLLFIGTLATCMLTGCFSIDSAVSQTSGEEHVIVANFGWRLFNVFPLFCGNATSEQEGRIGPFAFFRDDVTMDKVQERFYEYANERGKTPDTVVYHTYDSVLFDVPFTQIPVPIPYLFCFREIQISGVIK